VRPSNSSTYFPLPFIFQFMYGFGIAETSSYYSVPHEHKNEIQSVVTAPVTMRHTAQENFQHQKHRLNIAYPLSGAHISEPQPEPGKESFELCMYFHDVHHMET